MIYLIKSVLSGVIRKEEMRYGKLITGVICKEDDERLCDTYNKE